MNPRKFGSICILFSTLITFSCNKEDDKIEKNNSDVFCIPVSSTITKDDGSELITIYEYNSKNLLIGKKVYNNDILVREFSDYNYTNKWQLSHKSIIDYYYGGSRILDYNYEYNEKGKLTYESSKYSDNKFQNSARWQYNKEGREIGFQTYSDDMRIYDRKDYSYDEKGNVTSHMTYLDTAYLNQYGGGHFADSKYFADTMLYNEFNKIYYHKTNYNITLPIEDQYIYIERWYFDGEGKEIGYTHHKYGNFYLQKSDYLYDEHGNLLEVLQNFPYSGKNEIQKTDYFCHE